MKSGRLLFCSLFCIWFPNSTFHSVICTGDSFDSFSPGHYVQIMAPTDHSWELIDLESTATTENKAVFSAVFFASAVLHAGFLVSFFFMRRDFRRQYIKGSGANKLCLSLS